MEREGPDSLLRVDMIRCDLDSAIIEAGDGRSAYVLKRNKKEPRISNRDVFNIHAKFHYNQRITQSGGGVVELMPVTDQRMDRDLRPPVK